MRLLLNWAIDMLRFCTGVCVLFAVVKSDNFISDGSWRIIEIAPCENQEQYEIWFNVTKYKLTRTKDVFDAHCYLPEAFDGSYSLHAEISKDTEGGWKDYSILTHDSVLEFCRNHSRENHDKLVEAMGLDKDIEAIPEGAYRVKEFEFDHCNMPPQGILGLFKSKAFILNRLGVRVGCIVLTVEFREELDNCGGEDDDDK